MFIFKKLRDKDNEFDKADITLETYATGLPEVLEDFKAFLQASGYHIHPDQELTLDYEDSLKEEE